jgi:CRP-like cAMP-binding protein
MPLADDLENLSRIPLFAVFDPRAMNALAFRSETRALRAGDVLFRRDEMSDGGFILTAGRIEFFSQDDAAPAYVAQPWTLIGETALMIETTRPVTAIAAEPSTVLKIARPQFIELLERHPLTAARVQAIFCDRLLDSARAMAAFGASA